MHTDSAPIQSAISAELRTIPRDQHTISRRQISQNALRVLYRLHEAGHEAYLVGGAVRDVLVGLTPKDFDIATDATPEQVKGLFRNCRLIGRRFRLAHVVFGREIIEVATFRANVDDGSGDREVHDGGRLLRDNVYGTIEDDAVRRDFTANALYYAIADFSVRDYTGGFEDVQNRVMRLIGDPDTRYREDPVRMLRAVRLAAKLGFTIEPGTAEPIPRLASLLAEAAPARLFEECLKLFLSGHAVASFEGLERHGLLPALFPESAAALASNRSGALRAMVLAGLASTDARIAAGDPVSPAFLFATLLWPAFCRAWMKLQADGVQPVEAQRRAADRVTLHQVTTVALPRRFSLPMQEIWLLQARFPLRQRKRVTRTLSHPRFRAAFDFLVLRQTASDAHAADVAFWEEAQHDPDHAIALYPGEDEAGGDEDAPRRRRRRRRTPAAAG
ncbi:polynucleotide adenylyltransferase PcnB [Luteimonas fraxinea]|uniref:Poly(A) polymerase I n=1 Tax=Luteimonas fraxinea TaxID=2901869 RepID=A0ABS8UEC0_9GAMM|nr:polynucleotide adenylyltransferase PcnB [Luteimonas fraxinea]MCD9097813.1 polynucleotide adenylyltransferase PcnB [Luteimonas fraxinea]MCD9126466.1 polynucleotide adenylyltransferase PcnB [Luteimonas fraxinea]UHH09442.1 polynucleotide adenylyltransferase PcnB [Luteimonas fraxinea]